MTDTLKFFESTVVDQRSGCWIWTRGRTSKGYGALYENGKQISAHRFAYKAWVGEIPVGLYVLHRCDERACVNPEHLFLGTAFDNTQDMIAKGRFVVGKRQHGSDNPKSIFSESQVRQMRKLHSEGHSLVSINKRFGGHYSSVKRIINRKYWRHLI
jgi:hypothetical protein